MERFYISKMYSISRNVNENCKKKKMNIFHVGKSENSCKYIWQMVNYHHYG